jgi:hypothetical protein
MSERFSNHGKPGRKKTEVSLIRSSAAEYLTFVAASGQGGVHLKMATPGLTARG